MKLLKNKRTIVIILALTIIVTSLKSQTSFIWGKQIGSDKEEYALNHVIDNNGNIYVSGKTRGMMAAKNLGQNDGFITKIDSSGNTLWTRQFGSEGDEDVQWSAIDNKGFVYITGSTTGVLNNKNFGKEDIFVVKYDMDGNLEWTKQFGTDSTDISKGICTDNSGNIYITGYTTGKLGKLSYGKSDCFIMKLDNMGNQLFTFQFGTSADDNSYSITTGPDSGIFICGTTWGDLAGKNKGFIDGFTGQFTDKGKLIKNKKIFIVIVFFFFTFYIKKNKKNKGFIDGFTGQFTDKGNLIRYNQFGTDGFDIALIIKADNEKNIYIGGTTTGNLGSQQIGDGDCFLMKATEKGEILWKNQFGTKNHDSVRGLTFNPKVSDDIIISGLINLPPGEAFIRMYKKDGGLLWEQKFAGLGQGTGTSGKDVTIDEKGNIYHMGLTGANLFGSSSGGPDVYIVKLRSDKSSLNN